MARLRALIKGPDLIVAPVALNPIIKFTTLFGLLAVELAVSLTEKSGPGLPHMLSAAFFIIALVFIYRSFYGMRIESQ